MGIALVGRVSKTPITCRARRRASVDETANQAKVPLRLRIDQGFASRMPAQFSINFRASVYIVSRAAWEAWSFRATI